MRFSWIVAVLLSVWPLATARAGLLLDPGDVQLRHDLQLLNDTDAFDVPITGWPLSTRALDAAIDGVNLESLSASQTAAYRRLMARLQRDLTTGQFRLGVDASASVESRFIRTFVDTPRDEGEVGAHLQWLGERFVMRLSATAVANPFDGDDVRPDGSFVGAVLGNWILTAGWQDRWWGPGNDGSLILSTNARPTPGVMLQRNESKAFDQPWLRWVGPWTMSVFFSELDDTRTVSNAQLFGVRGSFRPPGTGLEIGVSRAAQWCGDGRPCGIDTFGDLLVGNDNRGVNVAAEDEPGNQLGGFDIRWALPKGVPVALYMQWIGEDGRGGGEGIGSWLRQAGLEYWGDVGGVNHRTHLEISDTTCREGGFGFSDKVPGCAYEHTIYTTGFRYQSRALAHSADADSLSYSLGSTLVQSSGETWDIVLRHMKINRDGSTRNRHTISQRIRHVTDFQLVHYRATTNGTLGFGLGYSSYSGASNDGSDLSAFIQWSAAL